MRVAPPSRLLLLLATAHVIVHREAIIVVLDDCSCLFVDVGCSAAHVVIHGEFFLLRCRVILFIRRGRCCGFLLNIATNFLLFLLVPADLLVRARIYLAIALVIVVLLLRAVISTSLHLIVVALVIPLVLLGVALVVILLLIIVLLWLRLRFISCFGLATQVRI